MTSAGVGQSKHFDAYTAGKEAATLALQEAGANNYPLVTAIVYATIFYEQEEVLQAVRSVLPEIPIVGSSTQGISHRNVADETERVVGVALIASDTITARSACQMGLGVDSFETGRQIASILGPPAEPQNPLLIWYDPLTGGNIEALLEGLSECGFPLAIGGGAGQPWGSVHQTFQYYDHHVLHDSVIALRLDNCEMVYDLTNGTEPLGLELVVTKSEGNVIRHIDNTPALDVWKAQLGVSNESEQSFNIDDTAAWAIGVMLPEELRHRYEGPITRAVFGLKEETSELLLQAPIPAGTSVQLCHRTPHAVFDRSLKMAARMGKELSSKDAFLALSFECGARPRPFLGDQKATEEIQQIQALLGQDIPWLGMYAWGEIAPIGEKSFFHNYTFPLCVLCE